MARKIIFHAFCLLMLCSMQTAAQQNWTNYARLSGHGLDPRHIENVVDKAGQEGSLGIEFDNDITGRYDSFLDPESKLRDIENAAKAAHRSGNHAFIYIAGLECITANADRSAHSLYKDHPDWVQRDASGKPAIFTGGTAFWLQKGDEDVWISPYAKEWRARYMDIVKRIAATGIDGIYIDVVYWMWLFPGWENSWASFDDYTVAAFREKTGLDAKKDFIPGDFHNPNFLKWVDFRISTMTDFFRELYEKVKSVNPNCLVIPEISPSIDADAVRSGADAYQLEKYSDVITHEFYINTNTGAKRNTFDWLTYSLGISTLRAFDEDHATWLLSYSWDHEKNTDAREAMKLLSCTQLLSQGNYWDAPGHEMAGSNDYSLRKEIFAWTKKNEDLLYAKTTPIDPIGVFFSPETRNYFMDDYTRSYYGILHLLLNNHFEYQVVTPRTLKEFNGRILMLPDAAIFSAAEEDALKNLYLHGVKLILTGETGYYSAAKELYNWNEFINFLKENKTVNRDYLYLPECPGAKYFEKKDSADISAFHEVIMKFMPNFEQKYTLKASNYVKAQPVNLGDKDGIFITNLRGLPGYSRCVPTTESKMEINFKSSRVPDVYYIPYLGERQKLTPKSDSDAGGLKTVTIVIPQVKYGGIVIIDK